MIHWMGRESKGEKARVDRELLTWETGRMVCHCPKESGKKWVWRGKSLVFEYVRFSTSKLFKH